MKLSLIAFAMLLAPILAHAQGPVCNSAAIPICSAPPLPGANYTKAGAIPTTATRVTVGDAYISQIVLSGGATGVTVTITDGNGIIVLNAVSLAANSTYVISFPEGYWCQGGFSIFANAAGSSFQIKLKQ